MAVRKTVAGAQSPPGGEGERGAKLPYRCTDTQINLHPAQEPVGVEVVRQVNFTIQGNQS